MAARQLAVPPKETPEIVFEAVVHLFSRLDPKIEAKDVIDAMHKYCEKYNEADVPGIKANRIAHNMPKYQLAYLVRYFYPHIEVTMDVLRSITDKHKSVFYSVLKKEVVRICCLGGGPLPEIFALSLCMQQLLEIAVPTTDVERQRYQRFASYDDCPGKPVSPNHAESLLSVHSLDLHAEVWKECFDAVADLMTKHKITYIPTENVKPVKCDLTNPLDVCRNLSYIQKSDIVFASKVFSDIWTLAEGEVKESLRQVLHHIQVDALFIYIDNQSGNSVDWFNSHNWEQSGFKKLLWYNKTIEPENKMPVGTKLDNKPIDAGKQDKKVTVRVLQKFYNPPGGIDMESTKSSKRQSQQQSHPSSTTPTPPPKLRLISKLKPSWDEISPTESTEEAYYLGHRQDDNLRKTN